MNHNEDYIASSEPKPEPGPFLAKVVSHLDTSYMGTLEVEILRSVGGNNSEGQLHQVKMMSPFYGVTGAQHVTETNDYNNTQKSYGMWFVPPDPGTIVVVIFIEGDPKRGYWMGCIADENMNFMIPGLAATESVIDETSRMPTAEYNKVVNATVGDPEQFKKPVHPFAAVLAKQGLLKDDIRGITTSSARRETPSMVFGVSTPGPVDRSSGAKTGTIGKAEWEIKNAFVSRLGGTTLVMDDGDAAFLRKTPASDGPPEYAAVEQGDDGGNVGIPHNELFRIRTRTGHQILLHNSEDLIYIGNARGTAWIELTSNGKIDIYAADSISLHTKGDYNVTADGNINLTAKSNINLNAGTDINITAGGAGNIKVGADGKLTVGGDFDLKTGGDNKFTAGGNTNLNSGGNHLETAAAIHMNGPGAATAGSASDAIKAPRVPDAEPWAGHENLHDTKLAYTTKTDTFKKVKGA
jgi:hypothetical protein